MRNMFAQDCGQKCLLTKMHEKYVCVRMLKQLEQHGDLIKCLREWPIIRWLRDVEALKCLCNIPLKFVKNDYPKIILLKLVKSGYPNSNPTENC